MRIAHIEDFFHPDAGYQINILSKYQVKQGHNVTVVTSEMGRMPQRLKSFFGFSDIEIQDRAFTERTGVNILRVPIFMYYSGRSIYTLKLFRTIKDIHPDILYVHGNGSFAGIIFTILYRRLGFALIMDNHMVKMAISNSFSRVFHWFYRLFIKGIIVKNKIKVIRVVNDGFIMDKEGIPESLSPVIAFGTDTMQFHPNVKRKDELKSIYNIGINDFVVLYMGKLTKDKGALLLAKAFHEKFDIQRKVILVIVGNVSTEYGGKVEEVLSTSENNILRFPTQKYNDLPDFYHLSDIVVFPRLCSLSFFDAQACGVPVVLEDNIINQGRIIMNNGLLFKSGDFRDLRSKIKTLARMAEVEMMNMKQASFRYISDNKLDYEFIAEQYSIVISESISEFRNSLK